MVYINNRGATNMKKTYNTPELSVSKLNQLDTMTASGLIDPDVQLRERVENTYRMFSELTE